MSEDTRAFRAVYTCDDGSLCRVCTVRLPANIIREGVKYALFGRLYSLAADHPHSFVRHLAAWERGGCQIEEVEE